MTKKYKKHHSHGVLTEVQAKEIKFRLWWGETVYHICRAFPRVSSSLILNIRTGHRWHNVQWPNRQRGALPQSRSQLIEQARKLALADIAPIVRMKLKQLTSDDTLPIIDQLADAPDDPAVETLG